MAEDRELREWITDVVHPHSDPVRTALDRCGLGARGVRAAADLARLPVTPLTELGDGLGWVLEPTASSLASSGPLTDRARFWVADAFGRRPEVARRRVEPRFRPVVWTTAPVAGGPLFVAATAPDLDRLAAIGRRGLAVSGVRPDDRVVVLGTPLTDVPGWQLLAGCRDAGVAHLHLGPVGDDAYAVLAAAQPTVLAGDGRSLGAALAGGLPASVRLLLQLGSPDAPLPAGDLPVARWWAPAGVRCAWVACPDGPGFHTSPGDEVVEVVGGEVVWSGIGWTGSVWLRLGTSVRGRRVDDSCPACGRPGPRIEPRTRPAFAATLDAALDIDAWLGVRRADGTMAVVVVPAPDPSPGWRAALAESTGVRVVPVSSDRFRRARALAGDDDLVDEATVAEALRKAAPA